MKHLAIVLCLTAAPVFAQTPPPSTTSQPEPQSSRPAASPELKETRDAMRQACAPDVASLCKDVNRGGGKIAECLHYNREHLSPGCLAAWQKLRALHSYEH